MGFFDELLGGKKETYVPGEKRMLIRGGIETGSFQVDQTFDVRGYRTVVTGKVTFGALERGNKLKLGEKSAEIVSIEINRRMVNKAEKNQAAVLTLSNASKGDFKEGDLLSFKTK